jgi:hypothetical protein
MFGTTQDIDTQLSHMSLPYSADIYIDDLRHAAAAILLSMALRNTAVWFSQLNCVCGCPVRSKCPHIKREKINSSLHLLLTTEM